MMLPLSFSGPDSGLHCLESVEYLEPKHCLSSSLGFCFSIISYSVLVVSLRCACHSLLSTKLQLGAHMAPSPPAGAAATVRSEGPSWPPRVQHLRSHLFFSTSPAVTLPFCPAFTLISKVILGPQRFSTFQKLPSSSKEKNF